MGSSSSSATDGPGPGGAEPIAVLLPASLAILRAEAAPAHRRLALLLAGRSVVLVVEGESLLIEGKEGDVRVGPAETPPPAALRVATDRPTIQDVLDGRTTLTQAVLDDRLRVQGDLADVTAVLDALLVYAHGGVRAPSFPALRARFTGAGPHCDEEEW